MKNSTLIKGTAAIAVGAALLLGGGGTLAAWNQEASANPGTILTGDLNLEPVTTEGVWKAGTTDVTAAIKAGTYKVVPGDVLTFTQDLKVTLVGANMAAKISAVDAGLAQGFSSSNVQIDGPKLTIGGSSVSNPLTASADPRTVTATITFTFLPTTSGRTDTNATFKFNDVKFILEQVTA